MIMVGIGRGADRRLLEQLGPDELKLFLAQIDRLTETAGEMLDAEKRLS